MTHRLLDALLGRSRGGRRDFPVDPSAEITGLALYLTPWCPFCGRVTRAMAALGAEGDIELRALDGDPAHRGDLLAARGRGTVPVLRITRADHDDVWMPESADIVAWLRARYAPRP